jgi:hypothetical protein
MEGSNVSVPRIVGELLQARENLLQAHAALGIEGGALFLHGTWLFLGDPYSRHVRGRGVAVQRWLLKRAPRQHWQGAWHVGGRVGATDSARQAG